MPRDNRGQHYETTGRGLNQQGNQYSTRRDDNGNHGYHYSNKDGGYYYKNFDDSKYYASGDGRYAHYDSPSGSRYVYDRAQYSNGYQPVQQSYDRANRYQEQTVSHNHTGLNGTYTRGGATYGHSDADAGHYYDGVNARHDAEYSSGEGVNARHYEEPSKEDEYPDPDARHYEDPSSAETSAGGMADEFGHDDEYSDANGGHYEDDAVYYEDDDGGYEDDGGYASDGYNDYSD